MSRWRVVRTTTSLTARRPSGRRPSPAQPSPAKRACTHTHTHTHTHTYTRTHVHTHTDTHDHWRQWRSSGRTAAECPTSTCSTRWWRCTCCRMTCTLRAPSTTHTGACSTGLRATSGVMRALPACARQRRPRHDACGINLNTLLPWRTAHTQARMHVAGSASEQAGAAQTRPAGHGFQARHTFMARWGALNVPPVHFPSPAHGSGHSSTRARPHTPTHGT
jgi:hypothetical protein